MKRRPQQSDIEPPARIRIFDPADWPNGDVELWKTERREFVQLYGYPGDPVEWIRSTYQQVVRARRL